MNPNQMDPGQNDPCQIDRCQIDGNRISSLEQLREVIPEPDPMMSAKLMPRLGAIEREFIRRSPMLFLATTNAQGEVTVSPRGDGPGFVGIADDETLLIPERPGNRLAIGLTSLLENPNAGLLLVVPGCGETLRLEGRVELTRDPELLERLAARGRPALLVMRFRIRRCYFQCSRAFARSSLWQSESWPTPPKFSWGRLAQQWFGMPDEQARQLEADIAREAAENL